MAQQQQGTQVQPQYVITALQRKVGDLTNELVLKDAYIEQLKAELEQAKALQCGDTCKKEQQEQQQENGQ